MENSNILTFKSLTRDHYLRFTEAALTEAPKMGGLSVTAEAAEFTKYLT
jgi:hypothetical protein